MKHWLVFQHEPSINACLDSRSGALSQFRQISKTVGAAHTPFPTIIGYVPRWSSWTLLKEHKCQGNYSGKRKHCTAVVQDMASGVFRTAHLKGCHCRPACLLVGFSVWVFSTIVSYSGYAENLSQSSAKADDV